MLATSYDLDYSTLGNPVKVQTLNDDHTDLLKMMADIWPATRNFYRKTYSEIREWQLERIKKIVDFAYIHVPLYHEKYSKVGFKPGDIKSWNDFESLPILYKSELIDGFPLKSVSDQHSLEYTTRSSGSSGTFVTLAVSKEAIYEDTIQGIRQIEYQSGNKYTPDDVVLFIYTCPWWVSSVGGKYKSEFISTSTPIKEAVKTIFELKPSFLSTYPTYLKNIVKETIELKKAGIKTIIVHSEHSSKKERVALSQTLDIPVLDEFSSEELTRIALECPHRHYHLEEDAAYTEIVDFETKKNVDYGTQGLLIGTNLLNLATPIIRYHQGDTAKIIGVEKCSCGSNFRTMDPIVGRYMDSIISDDGRIIPASCFMDLAYDWFLQTQIPVHGMQYQIVQSEKGNISVYLVPGLYELTTNNINAVKESLYKLLPKSTKITVKKVTKIPHNKGIKYRPVISFKNLKQNGK